MNLPKGWEYKSIKDVFEIVKEKGVENSTPYLEIGDVDINSKKYLLKAKPAVKGCKISKSGDLLVSRVRPTRGAIVQIKEDTIPVSSAFTILRNTKILHEAFPFYFFAWNTDFLNFLGENCSGSLYPTVSESILIDFKIPIPPLPEQQAIVAKIEELLSELDNGKQQLQTAQQQLKVYRQSLLKWAFEGKLTKSWREAKTDLPFAKDLQVQIEIGKNTFYQNQLKEWEHNLKIWIDKGHVEKKPSKPKALTNPDKPNVEQNEKKWNIPKNWIWSQMGTLCFVTKLAGFEYTDYVKYDDNGDLPVLKAENVGQFGFKKTVFSKVKTESIKMLTRSQLFGGELIIVFVGAGTGNVAMVPFNHKYFLGPNIGMARPYFNINSKYLELFYQSIFGKNLMLSAVKAVAQPSLSMGTIRQTPIAFPSIEEQDKIVAELESKLTVCDKIEETISQSLLQAETLKQSILKKAFEGKLI